MMMMRAMRVDFFVTMIDALVLRHFFIIIFLLTVLPPDILSLS